MGFYRKLSPTALAVLDLCDYYGEGQIITRINVPRSYRNQGHGTALLHQCLAQADRDRITLWLEIAESDGLTYEQLEAWYKRHGFENLGGIYRRLPLAPFN